jgi:diguanylate cyclase (GGDEF)-like protein
MSQPCAFAALGCLPPFHQRAAMYLSDDETVDADEAGTLPAMPLRLLLRFSDEAYERRFVKHYVAFYFRFAQISLLLGVLLILGDFIVDRIDHAEGQANWLRLTVAVPLLLGGLAFSSLPKTRRYWQAVMLSFIVVMSICLFVILVKIDAEGGAGLKSWVGVLNFTFLEFYCFVILGVQFRYALMSGLVILLAFEVFLWGYAGLLSRHTAYWSYHVVTLFVLAASVGWWREFLLRKEFVARAKLDDLRATAEQRALLLANYDDVTGLPNRRLFNDLAGRRLERARRRGVGCAVLHVSIDRLGGVHDAYGRSQSDVLMTSIAQRLRVCARSSDLDVANAPTDETGVVARLGDNSFSVLVSHLDAQERASVMAQRVLAAVAQPIPVEGESEAQPLVLHASVGIALFPGDAQDLARLTRFAEQAARAAKAAGSDQHQFFDQALNARAKDRMLLESELRHAIQAGQLRLHYQPKIDVNSGRLVGAETLVRWQHPERGLILPGHFIPLAEETGLIAPLTDWVLDTACAGLRQWLDQGWAVPPLSVNVPATSLVDGHFLDQLKELVQRYRLHPSSLTLELTETMLVGDVTSAVEALSRLRDLGFGLSLDDFGTGYSSLSYLKRLPMSELKIDRSFVVDVELGGRHGALATTIIVLGQELGLQVVAEGVETEAQSNFLRAQGCAIQQGYLFSRPVPRAEFEQMLKRPA